MEGRVCPITRKAKRTRSSSESEENQQPKSTDHEDQSPPRGRSPDKDSSSDSNVETESAMKRSQRFSKSFSFGEDHQLEPTKEGREEEPSPKNSKGGTELVEAECMRDAFHDTHHPPRSGVFRPQALWLAMTRCLSLRWRPCLSINRQTNRKSAYQVDLDQSEDTQSFVSSESTNESSSSTSPSDDRDVTLEKRKEEEVRSRGVKSGPAPCRGISRSSPTLPRTRQATDSALASLILEKEMFLRIELVESGAERDALRYRAEWKLSERTKKLAEGVWLSRSQQNNGMTY